MAVGCADMTEGHLIEIDEQGIVKVVSPIEALVRR